MSMFLSIHPLSRRLGDEACNRAIQFWAHCKEFLPSLSLMWMYSDYNHNTEVLLWELDKGENQTQNEGISNKKLPSLVGFAVPRRDKLLKVQVLWCIVPYNAPMFYTNKQETWEMENCYLSATAHTCLPRQKYRNIPSNHNNVSSKWMKRWWPNSISLKTNGKSIVNTAIRLSLRTRRLGPESKAETLRSYQPNYRTLNSFPGFNRTTSFPALFFSGANSLRCFFGSSPIRVT